MADSPAPPRAVTWRTRFDWAREYGGTFWGSLVCAIRGYHDWNTTGDGGPIPPTSCLYCRAKYTEEWHEKKMRIVHETLQEDLKT
jgi:hypothetical protein